MTVQEYLAIVCGCKKYTPEQLKEATDHANYALALTIALQEAPLEVITQPTNDHNRQVPNHNQRPKHQNRPGPPPHPSNPTMKPNPTRPA